MQRLVIQKTPFSEKYLKKKLFCNKIRAFPVKQHKSSNVVLQPPFGDRLFIKRYMTSNGRGWGLQN